MKFGLENISALCTPWATPNAPLLRARRRHQRQGIGDGDGRRGAAAAGHRTARYTSPHLVRLEERFVIDGVEVDDRYAARGAWTGPGGVDPSARGRHARRAANLLRGHHGRGLRAVSRGSVEIAVLEVGLGGRLDATNVVTTCGDRDYLHRLRSSGTAGHDARVDCPRKGRHHQAWRSCRVRAASFRSRTGDRVDLCRSGSTADPGVRASRYDRARRRHSRYPDTGSQSPRDHLALEGAHQRHNAAVAVALLEELSRDGVAISDAAIRDALTHVRWPGRLEHFSVGGTPVLIDAAHNPAGATALAAYLEEHGWRDATLVFGAMADKDVRGMLEALLRPAHVWGRLVCTTASTARALPHRPLPRSPWRSPGEAFRSKRSRILRLRSTEPWPSRDRLSSPGPSF